MNLFTINVTSANIIDVHIVLMNDCELFGVDVFIAKKYDGFNFISFFICSTRFNSKKFVENYLNTPGIVVYTKC